jgi:hypothetical protein
VVRVRRHRRRRALDLREGESSWSGGTSSPWVGGELCLLGDDDLARGKSGDGRARSRSRTATHGEGGSGAGTKSGSLAAQEAASSGARRRSVDLLDLGKFSARATRSSAKKASSTGPWLHPVLETL